MNNPSTKLWLCFLLNVLSVFDRFNAFFQTSTYTAHKLYGESVRLLKTVLSFFVKPQVIREHLDDLTKLPYHDNSTHLPNNDILLGKVQLHYLFMQVIMKIKYLMTFIMQL